MFFQKQKALVLSSLAQRNLEAVARQSATAQASVLYMANTARAGLQTHRKSSLKHQRHQAEKGHQCGQYQALYQRHRVQRHDGGGNLPCGRKGFLAGEWIPV